MEDGALRIGLYQNALIKVNEQKKVIKRGGRCFLFCGPPGTGKV